MMGKSEIRQGLAASKLFEEISSEALNEIANIAHVKIVPPNTIIHHPGDALSSCSIISSGIVRISTKGKKGAKYELVKLGPGESFAELALLSEGPAPGSAETQETTTLIVIPRDRFEPILRNHPDVIQAVGKRISRIVYGAGSALESAVERRIFTPRMSVIDFGIILGLSIFFALGFNQANPKKIPLFPKSDLEEAVSFVKPSKVFEAHQTGNILIIDAMPSGFYEKEHIPGAENLPLAMFDFMYDMTLSHEDKDKGIIVYGKTISRHYDEEVANKLVIRGHRNVQVLEDGLRAWKNMGYPVEP